MNRRRRQASAARLVVLIVLIVICMVLLWRFSMTGVEAPPPAVKTSSLQARLLGAV
ncbi:MAG: hypothetical protein JSV79_10875 [Armatimonadota bacterium]|nr:MAG: hypothetical protein JSV79_10875 [Armatimonadota bacterium]